MRVGRGEQIWRYVRYQEVDHIGNHHEREARLERAWRMLRVTSVAASAVVVIVLVAIDFSFRFASWQLNVVVALVAIWLLILLKLDYWLHQLVRRLRRFRR